MLFDIPPVMIYPFDAQGMFRWDFVYLHGDAEFVYEQRFNAPDLFSASQAKPRRECNVFCLINTSPALAVIRLRHGNLIGRVALLSDTAGLKHVLSPENWS